MKYLIQSLILCDVGNVVEFTIEENVKEDNDDRYIEMIMEIPEYINHWDNYELKLFYEWIFLYKKYIPVNFEILVDEWINKERKRQISLISETLRIDLSCMEDIENYNNCIKLLNLNINKNVRG